ncbi:AzlC family ABC transporter permease [Cryptosporangium phraense]|uniref:Branched-chain amino acid ABC transporter permease n=1 Tax=Cryptosporangium phraense TaxID=2593070 RepID=A0A545AZ89_9ACTN|nr:AzlC family ABC transporter permease [Cryptosporangium phraense]TQS46643.1 branched-chain amino acid ABC transporter permease [Cryptosporangium phraense]
MDRSIVRDALGVGLATGAYGIAFGAAGVAAGFSVLQTCLSSLLVFTGASQFALVGVIGAGGGVAAAVGSALLLGARNALYGVRLSSLLGWTGWRRAIAAQGVIDESAAMALPRTTPEASRLAFVSTALSVFVFWNAATLIGAVGATAVGDPAVLGLDAAAPAGFLALLAPRLREGGGAWRVAAAGAVIALLATPWLPPGVPVLLASFGVLVALGRPR